MKYAYFFSIFFIFFFLTITGVSAADTLVFDSTDNYLGACQLTNKSDWELKEDIAVTKFQIWYSWNQGEVDLPVQLLKDGEKFAEFTATRADCDPYQKQWCNADYKINKLFTKGKYSTAIPNSRQCLKPGGTGAIRLYKEEISVKKEEPSPAPTVTTAPEIPTAPPAIIPSPPASCTCNQTIILATAAATSLITSIIVVLLLRR